MLFGVSVCAGGAKYKAWHKKSPFNGRYLRVLLNDVNNNEVDKSKS